MPIFEPFDPNEPVLLNGAPTRRVVAAWEWVRPMRVTLKNGTVREGTLKSRNRRGFDLDDAMRLIRYEAVDSIDRVPNAEVRQVPADVIDALVELYDRTGSGALDPAEEAAVEEYLKAKRS